MIGRIERFRTILLPIAVLALTLLLAACNNGGGSGPGY